MTKQFRIWKLTALAMSVLLLPVFAACGSNNSPMSNPTSTSVPSPTATAGVPTSTISPEDQRSSVREQRREGETTATSVQSEPVQVTEEIFASSVDGVLFDIKLSGSVADSDSDRSFRDEIEILSPGSTEFQGHFPAPGGDLLIVSCFASECQEGDGPVTFEVRYWTTDDTAITERSRQQARQ